MISKYNKVTIKSILLGTVIFAIIGGLSISINTSKASSAKNIAKSTTLQVQTPADTSKSTVNNASTGTVPSTIKKLPSDSVKPIVPFSSDIVIYNSYSDEDYPSGVKVTDVAALLNDKLVKEVINSSFIQCKAPVEYTKSYQSTRNLITKNVKNYSNTVLLDIHRDMGEKDNSNSIIFILAKKNPHYEANKKFVDLLIANIKNSSQVKTNICYYDYGTSYFNEDLSNDSAFIEFGNNTSSDSDIEKCVDALALALKNTQKVSSN